MENASKALIIAGAILISIVLISIGVILVNSGRDVTETGTAGMQSQKIQSFNNQFTPYEGDKTGADLRGLQSAVSASNAANPDYSVTLSGWSATLGATKKFTVTLGYDTTTGYVNAITVTAKN